MKEERKKGGRMGNKLRRVGGRMSERNEEERNIWNEE